VSTSAAEDPEREPQPGEVAAEDLTDELARKYDPSRLLKLISRKAGKQESLDASVRAKYESRLKVDLGHVRVITGEFAEEFNKRKNAYATTIGGTGMILMGGSPDRSMATSAGRALLGHELTHVAQAKRGLYRASRSEDQPFALEGQEAEDEAEEMEAMIEAEESGYGDPTGTPGPSRADDQMYNEKKAEEATRMVIERVFELIGDTMKFQDWRGGQDPRRP
jgi:hypothetical protein